MTDVRPSWDDYFRGIARAVSARSSCSRRHVGAVVVSKKTHRILGTGYNGSVPGAGHCIDGHCPRGRLSYGQLPAGAPYGNCIARHAEANAIIQAQRFTEPGDIIYITCEPCSDCEELITKSQLVWRV